MALSVDPYDVFAADPRSRHIWLADLVGRNPSTEVTTTYRFSTARYATTPTDTLPSQRYDALIVQPFEQSGRLAGTESGPMSGVMPGRVGGSIVLGQQFGALDTGALPQLGGVPIRNIAFGGRSAIVRHGGYSPQLGRMLTYAEFRVVFNGTCDGNPHVVADTVTFKLAPKDRNFEYPAQARTLWGLNYGLHFDGSNDYVSATSGTTTELDFTSGSFCLEGAFFVPSVPANAQYLMNRGLLNTDGWELILTASGTIRFRTNQSGASQSTISSAVPLNRWFWLSVRRVGTTVQILIDGVVSNVTSGSHTNPTTCARSLYFGRDDAGTGTAYFNGLMGELRAWNVDRNKSQINDTMHRPLDTGADSTTGLVGLWLLDEGTLTTATDTSTNDADGTISGATWIFTGTGNNEHVGRKMPDAWGPVKGWPPLMLHEQSQFSIVSSEQIDGFDRVDVGGASGMILENAETSFLTFVTSTTAAGKYDTCITSGGTYLRLGSVPSKALTVDVRGNAPGGTYLNTVGKQNRWIACNRGPSPLVDPTDLDTTSFSAFGTDCPQVVGHGYMDDVSIAEVMNFGFRSVGGVAFFARDTGLWTVERMEGVAGKSATVTVTHRDVAEGTLEVLDRSAPVWNVVVYYARNYLVMGSGDVVPGVLGTDREKFVKKEWRSMSWRSNALKIDHKDAKTLEVETGLSTAADALAEANRLGALYSTRDQGFRFLCRNRDLRLERMQAVYFHFEDKSRLGTWQSRFGTSATAKFLVFEVSDDTQHGGKWYSLWREST